MHKVWTPLIKTILSYKKHLFIFLNKFKKKVISFPQRCGAVVPHCDHQMATFLRGDSCLVLQGAATPGPRLDHHRTARRRRQAAVEEQQQQEEEKLKQTTTKISAGGAAAGGRVTGM